MLESNWWNILSVVRLSDNIPPSQTMAPWLHFHFTMVDIIMKTQDKLALTLLIVDVFVILNMEIDVVSSSTSAGVSFFHSHLELAWKRTTKLCTAP